MRWLRMLAGAVVLASLLAGCGATATPPAALSGSFAGASANANLFVAVVAGTLKDSGKHGVVAYACDGETISQWFRGEVTGITVDLTAANGAHLAATITAGSATGTLTLADGTTVDFEAPAATQPAGLYRAEATLDGEPFLGGWIVLPSGAQKGLGLKTTSGSVLKTGFSDPDTFSVDVGGTTLTTNFTDPDGL